MFVIAVVSFDEANANVGVIFYVFSNVANDEFFKLIMKKVVY